MSSSAITSAVTGCLDAALVDAALAGRRQPIATPTIYRNAPTSQLPSCSFAPNAVRRIGAVFNRVVARDPRPERLRAYQMLRASRERKEFERDTLGRVDVPIENETHICKRDAGTQRAWQILNREALDLKAAEDAAWQRIESGNSETL